MKGKIATLSIIGLILLAGGIAVYGFVIPKMAAGIVESVANVGNIFNFGMIQTSIKGLIDANLVCSDYVMYGLAGLVALLFLIQFIMLIVKKHPLALFETIGWILGGAMIVFCGLFLFTETGYCQIYDPGAKFSDGGYVGAIIAQFNDLGIKDALLGLVPVLLMLVGAILCIIAVIMDMAYMGNLEVVKKPKLIPTDASVYATDKLYAHEVAEPAAPKEVAPYRDGVCPAAPTPTNIIAAPATSPLSGPLLVQYINTYSPDAKTKKKEDDVPLSEVKAAMGDKPLTADEVRKIIKEELEGNKKPVIVTLPATAETQPAAPAITGDDVRKIVAEEIKNAAPAGDLVVEPEPAPVLTADDIRQIVSESLAAVKKEEPEPKPEPTPEPVDVRAIIKEELAAFRAEQEAKEKAKKEEEEKRLAAEKARREVIEQARRETIEQLRREEEEKKAKAEEEALKAAEAKKAEDEKKAADEKHEALLKQLEEARKAEEARRAEEEKKPTITAEDIRDIVADELAKLSKDSEDPSITADLIRTIVRQEFQAAAPIKEEKVTPVTVVVKDPEEPKPVVVEEPKPDPEPTPAPAPTPHITVVVNNPAPAPVEEKKPEKKPVGTVNPDLPPHDKIIRIPFPTRMVDADKDMKSNYNELKSEILSYGVKSRVSNSGDTFRLHKITFVKITIAGKSLKLYFALDPKEYANSTYPVQDVSHKNIYKDIPMVFKVKSELSMRRAKQLIADVMDKHGLEQGKIIPHNYAADLKDYVPTGSAKDDDDED